MDEQMIIEKRAKRLARAKGYPYQRPPSSFLFLNGSAWTFPDNSWQGPDKLSELVVTSPDGDKFRGGDAITSVGADVAQFSDDWTGVLGIGSNAGPEQLNRKFPAQMFEKGVIIPVVQGVLHDFDVVYTPFLSSYGASTATLEYSPGTVVGVFVTYLTEELLQRMHKTEGAYDLCKLDDIKLELGTSIPSFGLGQGCVSEMTSIFSYNHQNGSINVCTESFPTGSPIALKAIPALNRRFPALDEPDMLQAIRTILQGSDESISSTQISINGSTSPEDDGLDDWIIMMLDNDDLRRNAVDRLAMMCRPFSYKNSTKLMTLGNIYSSNVK